MKTDHAFLLQIKSHFKGECPKLKSTKSFPPKDLSHNMCCKCGQKGHYANKYPNAKANNASQLHKKKITFELTNIAKELTQKQCNMNRESTLSSLGDFMK